MTKSSWVYIPFSHRLVFCSSAWTLALLAAYFLLGPDGFQIFLFFPLGLPMIIPIEKWEIPMVIGWVIYAILTCVVLMLRNRRRFFVVFSILVILLLLNVVGCRVLFSAPPPIIP